MNSQPTQHNPADLRPKNAKSDLAENGAGLTLSRNHGDQVLICTDNGEIVVVTAIDNGDGMKIGIRCPRSFNAQRREVSPESWIIRAEEDAHNR